MEDISVYFTAIESDELKAENFANSSIGKNIAANFSSAAFPDLRKINLAFFGVNESRNAQPDNNCQGGADAVRPQLYKLFNGNHEIKIADLGNINAGHTIDDSYFALRSVLNELIKNRITPIIIGGAQHLTFANYLAYQNIEATVNLTSIDASLDLGTADDLLTSQTWLGKIIQHQPNHLFNFSNVGYQTYLTNPDYLGMMDKLFFDVIRLGSVRQNMEDTEPAIRNADIISVDISAIKMSDSPASAQAGPNGFYADEICQLMRYAGMSDKCTSIGFYEFNPKLDKHTQSAQLLAQMIWCFIDGFYNRKSDYPFKKTTDFTKYRVAIKELKNEIVFYKSIKSDRWWMEVPYPPDKRLSFERHTHVPCSYNTYQTALKDELPDQWWQTYQKFSF
jgi:arginase family enzyme